MKNKLFIALVVIFPFCVNAQTDSVKTEKLEMKAYVNFTQTTLLSDALSTDNLWHNRINAKYYFTDKLNLVIEGRNRLYYGASASDAVYSADGLNKRKGFFDLSFAAGQDSSWTAACTIDRLYLDYTYKKLQLTIGRQRINWGRTVAMNPNDIFNAASYFDVDYLEQAGSDAVRMQYYIGVDSKLELAAKLGSDDKLTAAALYKTNKFGYDFQFMGGLMNDEDIVGGLGWEGYIRSFSFRGEGTYFQPKENFADTGGVVLFSVGTDYMRNKFMLQAEFVYSGYAAKNSLEDQLEEVAAMYEFYYGSSLDFGAYLEENPATFTAVSSGGGEQNAKTIAFDAMTLFVNASYQLTPLITSSLSGMYFIDNSGYFISPTVEASLSQNIDFSLIGQYFNIALLDERYSVPVIYWRVKYSF